MPQSLTVASPPPRPPGRSSRTHHQVLASISRAAVLELLRSRAEPLGVGEVARHVGLHQNTVRSHLDLLVESGYAIRRSEAPRGPGRPRVVYEATAAPEGERNYRLLAEVLVEHIAAISDAPRESAVNAGRTWARTWGRLRQDDRSHQTDGTGQAADPGQTDGTGQAADPGQAGGNDRADATLPLSEEDAIAAVVRMLGDNGFAPELSADRTSINLHRCPFREMAVNNPDVVCGAHLGIIQGALAELGTAVSASRLIPFVTPGLCVTTLTWPYH